MLPLKSEWGFAHSFTASRWHLPDTHLVIIFTGKPARSAAMPVLVFGPLPVPNFTFIGAMCRPCGAKLFFDY